MAILNHIPIDETMKKIITTLILMAAFTVAANAAATTGKTAKSAKAILQDAVNAAGVPHGSSQKR
ncbi:MAG: hypothetical protein HC782_00250 [Gammaproteobacteria bacterium]|nr:hypothetical protein [Gammaproteobacteria bacterium]